MNLLHIIGICKEIGAFLTAGNITSNLTSNLTGNVASIIKLELASLLAPLACIVGADFSRIEAATGAVVK